MKARRGHGSLTEASPPRVSYGDARTEEATLTLRRRPRAATAKAK